MPTHRRKYHLRILYFVLTARLQHLLQSVYRRFSWIFLRKTIPVTIIEAFLNFLRKVILVTIIEDFLNFKEGNTGN
jgi:hypothetical protein